MISNKNRKKALYESIMRKVSLQIKDILNEATVFDGMDPETAEKLRRVKNRYASYKSKGGTEKAKAKIIADFLEVKDAIVNPKGKQAIEKIIAELTDGDSVAASKPVVPVTPKPTPVVLDVDDDDDDDDDEETPVSNVKPTIPVNTVEDEPEYPSYDEVEVEEPAAEPQKDYPSYDEVEVKDNDNEDITNATPTDILNDLINIAKTVYNKEEKEDLAVNDWVVEQGTDDTYRIKIANVPQEQEGMTKEELDAAIEAEYQRCDTLLSRVINKINAKYNIDNGIIDTCMWDDKDGEIIYGIDYDANYAE